MNTTRTTPLSCYQDNFTREIARLRRESDVALARLILDAHARGSWPRWAWTFPAGVDLEKSPPPIVTFEITVGVGPEPPSNPPLGIALLRVPPASPEVLDGLWRVVAQASEADA